jgi:isoamylase
LPGNEISWIDWSKDKADLHLLSFVQRLIALRTSHPVFHRRNFFQGRSIKGAGVKDILWLRPDGREMTDEEWGKESARSLGVFLAGEALDERDERAQPIKDQNFLLLMNAHHEEVRFQLPTVSSGMSWVVLVDTASSEVDSPGTRCEAGTPYALQARSLSVLVERPRDQVRVKERRNGG